MLCVPRTHVGCPFIVRDCAGCGWKEVVWDRRTPAPGKTQRLRGRIDVEAGNADKEQCVL